VSDTRYDNRIGWIWQVSCEKVGRMRTSSTSRQALTTNKAHPRGDTPGVSSEGSLKSEFAGFRTAPGVVIISSAMVCIMINNCTGELR
jgi:hypothetical protein